MVAAGAAVPPPPPQPPRLAAAGGMWVLDEPVAGFQMGQEVALPPGALVVGDRCFVTVDDRVTSITQLAQGVDVDSWVRTRLSSFLQADGRLLDSSGDLTGMSLAEADRLMVKAGASLPPLRGPPTVEESIRHMVSRASGGFMAAHDRWVVESRIELVSRSRYEHKVLSKALALAVHHDGLNIKRCVSFEYINRRRQLLEEAHREDPSRPSFEAAHLFMGEDDEGHGAHLSSALRAHIATEMSRAAAIQKERRKAQEARDTRAPNKNNKGKEKGGAP